uniref:Uncharacterized protein n=1 Tax=Arundo donax TaxID=35708 RepID=A0A0A9A080_ARUDO
MPFDPNIINPKYSTRLTD